MKIWYDTEFIEDGRTIDLISIGAVREDGRTFYAEVANCDLSRASEWVQKNVVPHLIGGDALMPRESIKFQFWQFCGDTPEFWGYYADYDWVGLCQLYGRMIDLPRGWPMYCRDVKQLCDSLGNPKLPEQVGSAHHALNDALWTREAWNFLQHEDEGHDNVATLKRQLARYEQDARRLTFAHFREANVRRCVKWHPAGIKSWSPSDWLTAVTGELGELASLLKMRNRERDGLPGNRFSPSDKQVADELADVLTYLDLLAAALGVDLGAAAVEKFNEVSARVGFPDRIDAALAEPKTIICER